MNGVPYKQIYSLLDSISRRRRGCLEITLMRDVAFPGRWNTGRVASNWLGWRKETLHPWETSCSLSGFPSTYAAGIERHRTPREEIERGCRERKTDPSVSSIDPPLCSIRLPPFRSQRDAVRRACDSAGGRVDPVARGGYRSPKKDAPRSASACSNSAAVRRREIEGEATAARYTDGINCPGRTQFRWKLAWAGAIRREGKLNSRRSAGCERSCGATRGNSKHLLDNPRAFYFPNRRRAASGSAIKHVRGPINLPRRPRRNWIGKTSRATRGTAQLERRSAVCSK